MAEYGAGTALQRVDDDLTEEISALIRRLYEQGSRHHELSSMSPDSFAYEFTVARAVMGLQDAVRRSAPLSPDEAEDGREEVRAALERALAQPPDSVERRGVLIPLTMPPEDESWTDRALLALRVEEALALCRSAEPERVTLGVGLLCYAALHDDSSLEDPPVELFLTSLRHPDAVVRAAAASGLGDVGQGLPHGVHCLPPGSYSLVRGAAKATGIRPGWPR
ncbi:hypothetical protein ABZT08_25470 [Streptomyces sp. NPDC005526]|uniref:hypothetical protein n=1 Tax=Streptomyces sp. NPDC005526 TaxID=3156885 RepID=UPI0033B1CB59